MISGLDGINIHNIRYTKIDKVKQLKTNWARIDICWNEIEKSKGVYDWKVIDESVSVLTSNKLKIYATISYTPLWMAGSIYDLPDPTLWSEFCKKVAERYKSRIQVYSLWNEPNLKTYSKFYSKPNKYVNNILIPGYIAIKSVGNFIVAAADLSTLGSSNWTSWISRLVKESSHYDIFSIHCYDHPVLSMKFKYNYGKIPVIGWLIPRWRPYKWYWKNIKKPIWLTECGYKATYGKSKEENNQLYYYRDLIKSKGSMKIDLIFGYQDHDYAGDSPWGLFDRKYNPKKIVEA